MLFGTMPYTQIRAIGTALPRYQYRQTDLARFMKEILDADRTLSRRIDYLYYRSQIDRRHTCVPIEFYLNESNPRQFPTTQHRMVKYEQEALPLCQAAISNALDQPHAPDLSTVTHLIVVSCTGFYAPGLDVQIVKALGLSPDVQRTLIGFMGCYAAFNGFRLADAFCRSDDSATVLLVCVELCSLHFQQGTEPSRLIANCIFADGAAAVFFTSIRDDQSQFGQRRHSLALVNSLSWIDEDSLEEMTWTIGDTGFEMHISSTVASILEVNLPDLIQRLLKPSKLSRAQVDFWSVHAGGRSILDTVQQCLDLAGSKLEDSRAVLCQYGNMSSPTVLFALERLVHHLQRGEEFQHVVAMGFGPGLTLEACLLESVF